MSYGARFPYLTAFWQTGRPAERDLTGMEVDMKNTHGSGLRYLALVLAGICSTAFASDMPRVFMTSVRGNGDLSTWPDAHGLTGLQAGDEICRTRAAAASLPDSNNYVAFLSDSNTDAYCRVHGATGRVYVDQCASTTLPTGAGPWFRMDDLPAIDVSQNVFIFNPAPGYSPRHILYDEFGVELPSNWFGLDNLAFSGTWLDGALHPIQYTCSDWTSTSGSAIVASAYRGYGWPDGGSTLCDYQIRLVCMEKGLNGTPLPRRKPSTARIAFVTSVSGTGNLATWADAAGNSSAAAGDAICQNRALIGGLPLPQSYKAWISTSLEDAIDRLQNDGPLYRTDGVLIAGNYSELTSGVLRAPLQINEYGQTGTALGAWAGTLENGRSSGMTCSNWTNDVELDGNFGNIDSANGFWTNIFQLQRECSDALGLYCIGDNDSLFLESFDE
jgi:hypothetical protein